MIYNLRPAKLLLVQFYTFLTEEFVEKCKLLIEKFIYTTSL